ncbi:MAG: cytochrome c biogenesis protein [Geminocystis sp.]|nr:cytochrome c biogenesis protein [Geminocystis sp.]HIK37183.1 cytochrome c biogenesis protein [Geminocystis sp. M7585_C2015_104]MCS7148426.1 cytochrome c biogenesis protein [Geminocystis sp.]MCX8078259.1 cytochrome c biogenesis protein [Geminocystis sp.]MDW8115986.1 cytochrome c biogenesis protein [Geminocystis sp.]
MAIFRLLSRRFVTVIADLRLAILLLLLIAVFSITGTIIEQNQPLDFYRQSYPEKPALFGFLTWKLLIFLGLDHVYTTWWYLTLLFLFGTSLTACTFKRQLPALKAARMWQYYDNPRQFNKLAFSFQLRGVSLREVESVLRQNGYRIYRNDHCIYAQKGLVGRIGPIVVHLGIIIILMGAMWGAFTGFLAQEIIASGQTFTINNLLYVGRFANLDKAKSFQVKVNKFWIDYRPDGSVDQFYSRLSIITKDGSVLPEKTIYVNHPLRYNGITFYQTSWTIAGVKFQLNNSPILQLPMAELTTENGGKIWGTWIPTSPDLSKGISLIVRDLQGTVFLYGMDGSLLQVTRLNTPTRVDGITLKIVDIIGATGLQIKSDPGVPIVYLGFAILMAGVVMSYVSFSQIWGFHQDDIVYFGGKTNRAQVAFEIEINKIVGDLSVGRMATLSVENI